MPWALKLSAIRAELAVSGQGHHHYSWWSILGSFYPQSRASPAWIFCTGIHHGQAQHFGLTAEHEFLFFKVEGVDVKLIFPWMTSTPASEIVLINLFTLVVSRNRTRREDHGIIGCTYGAFRWQSERGRYCLASCTWSGFHCRIVFGSHLAW